MIYQWKPFSCLKADAQAAGEQMEQLEQNGGLTPTRLLEANREVGTPLHDDFEWNDTVAAEKFRENQAAYIIRHLVVHETTSAQEPVAVRAFVRVVEDQEPIYASFSRVLSDAELRGQMLDNAKADLLAFKTKYESLEELSAIFTLIREVTA